MLKPAGLERPTAPAIEVADNIVPFVVLVHCGSVFGMAWWFHNRITVGDRRLEPQQCQWVLHQAEGQTVPLWKNHDQTLDVDWLRLDGIEYETSDAALEAGRRWRQ